MDTRQRPRAHTIGENGQSLNAELHHALDSVPEETNTKNRTSLPPGFTSKSLFIKNSFSHSSITTFCEFYNRKILDKTFRWSTYKTVKYFNSFSH